METCATDVKAYMTPQKINKLKIVAVNLCILLSHFHKNDFVVEFSQMSIQYFVHSRIKTTVFNTVLVVDLRIILGSLWKPTQLSEDAKVYTRPKRFNIIYP